MSSSLGGSLDAAEGEIDFATSTGSAGELDIDLVDEEAKVAAKKRVGVEEGGGRESRRDKKRYAAEV